VRGRIALVAAVVALGAWCGWVSGFHRTSGAAEITWVQSTVMVGAVGVALWCRRDRLRALEGWAPAMPWPRPGRGGARRALVGVVPWLVLIVLALAWDVLGIDTGPHQYHLTISALAQAYRPLNAALLLGWMLVGVGYQAARVRAPRVPAAPGAETEGGVLFGCAVAGLGPHPGAPTQALLLPSSPPVGVAFWVAVPLAAVVIDVAARRSDGRLARAGELVRFISDAPWVNALLVLAWLVAGYHLFAR
jgi:hypothetical protein